MDRFDVFVIGGGATGSEIAFRLGRHAGMAVGLAERDKLGGECNLYGCVPTKVMLRSAKIASLARDAERVGVRVLMKEARIVRPNRIEMADGTGVEAERIVLATGSESVTPPIEGIE